MKSHEEYQFQKLNDLLSASFNNVKFDTRDLRAQIDVLKKQLADLSIESANTALLEQIESSKEQNKSILILREELTIMKERLTEVSDELNREKKNNLMQNSGAVVFSKLNSLQSAQAVKKANATKIASAKVHIADGEVKITKVQFKAPKGGKDLNGEWVELTGYNVDMTGFSLSDEGKKHTFKFPKGFTIYGPIKLFTGKGKNTNTKLYWGNPRPVWNDDQDVATLRNEKGLVVSKVKSESVHNFVVLK